MPDESCAENHYLFSCEVVEKQFKRMYSHSLLYKRKSVAIISNYCNQKGCYQRLNNHNSGCKGTNWDAPEIKPSFA